MPRQRCVYEHRNTALIGNTNLCGYDNLAGGQRYPGKMQPKRDLTQIIANHNIPYVAQTAPMGNFKDIYTKAEKALYTPGAAFINVIAPCPRGWRYDTPKLMDIIKLAVEPAYGRCMKLKRQAYDKLQAEEQAAGGGIFKVPGKVPSYV